MRRANTTRKVKKSEVKNTIRKLYTLNDTDFKKVLKHYRIPVPVSKKTGKIDTNKTRNMVYTILADKLCKCIKTVKKRNNIPEASAVAICNNSIFGRRGLQHFRFTCKKGAKLGVKKNTKTKLVKTRKNIL
jgi:hypothetical protein